MKRLVITCEDLKDLGDLKRCGADEVVLSLKDSTFLASTEFSMEEILEGIQKGHELGLRIGVMMNRLFPQEDISEALSHRNRVLDAGADSVIFADCGLLYGLKENMDKMIYQPETLLTSAEDASFWMGQGLQSVTISSLVTKEEIAEIVSRVPHAGIVVHGRLLMSVSRRKLVHAYAEVAQKEVKEDYNKHLFLRENKREGRMPVLETSYACMIFSDFVQDSMSEMPLFMEAGAERYVIDAAYLSRYQALDALAAYRAIVDGGNVDGIAKDYQEKYEEELPLSDGYYGQKTIK